jgi:hypothetical protein
MKRTETDGGFKWAALAIMGFLLSVGFARADIVVNRFNTTNEVSQWRFDFGGAAHTSSWDATSDANGNPGSGSWKVTLTLNTNLAADNKGAYTKDGWFPGLDGSTLSSLQFDVKVDPASALDAFGNNGSFSIALRNTDNYNYIQQFSGNLKSADGWRHIVVNPLIGPYDHIRALTWQLYGGPSQNINGPVTLWLDNILFTEIPEPSAFAFLGVVAALLMVRQRQRCRVLASAGPRTI